MAVHDEQLKLFRPTLVTVFQHLCLADIICSPFHTTDGLTQLSVLTDEKVISCVAVCFRTHALCLDAR